MSLLLLSALTGCVVGGDAHPRPRDLPSSTIVDRTRVLAVRAEPPEIAPGGTATFEALLPDPDGNVAQVLWVACLPDRATPVGCAFDPSALDEDATPDDLADAGIIGFEPGLPPSYTADDAVLDDLAPHDRLEGLNVTVQLLAFPEGTGADGDIDFGEVESALKRLVVSEAATPNANPDVTGFRADGFDVPEGAVLEVDPGQAYDVDVLLPDDTVEDYLYVTPDGVTEERTEEPYVTWYTTAGSILNPYGLYPYTAVSWRAPSTSGQEGTLYAVVRDRRGGMGWWVQPFRVR